MLELVITGGQTGADIAAWRAAKAAGIPTGGWMTKGYLTEDGPRPEFAELYGARERSSTDYRVRTDANVNKADGLLWFGAPQTPGGRLTLTLAGARQLPLAIVGRHDDGSPCPLPEFVAAWLTVRTTIRTLMVAGNRESKAPGIGAWVEAYLAEVFARLKEEVRR